MNRKIRALGATAAAGVLTIALAGVANAESVTYHNYQQTTGGFSCTHLIEGTATLSVNVSGDEFRHQDQEFATYVLATKLVAKKFVDGTYRKVGQTGWMYGELGSTYQSPPWVVAPFQWDDFPSTYDPQMSIDVTNDGQYKVTTITKNWDIDGVHLSTLKTTEGSCSVDG